MQVDDDNAAEDSSFQEEEEEEDALDDEAMEDGEMTGTSNADPMSALVESARARAQEYDNEQIHSDSASDSADDTNNDPSAGDTSLHSTALPVSTKIPDSSARAHTHTFHTILSSSSILLYILDARDPLATRSRTIERQIAAADTGSKRLILILNKIDLVPSVVLKAWLMYLRRYHPTLPLKASSSAPNAKTFDHKALTSKGTLEALLRALKATAHKLGHQGSTTVGVLGYPNVGKSSVINGLTSLLSRKKGGGAPGRMAAACPTGAEAGVTTSVREVKIDNKLKVLDAPGIVFRDDSNEGELPTTSLLNPNSAKRDETAHLTLLSCLPPKSITDPIPAITLLLSRLQAADPSLSTLLSTYNIPALSSSSPSPSSSSSATTTTLASPKDLTTPFLVEVARKRGRLGKGGVPNLNAAAMCVLSDWRDGRLQGGWIMPPPIIQGGMASGEGMDVDGDHTVDNDGRGIAREVKQEERKIVQEWGEEFRIEGLW